MDWPVVRSPEGPNENSPAKVSCRPAIGIISSYGAICITRLLSLTGARRGEILEAKWFKIDFKRDSKASGARHEQNSPSRRFPRARSASQLCQLQDGQRAIAPGYQHTACQARQERPGKAAPP